MGFIKYTLQRAEEGLFDITGDIDFLNSNRASLADFLIRIIAASMQNQRNRSDLINLFQQLKLELRHKSFRIQAMRGADGNRKSIDARPFNEFYNFFRIGIRDIFNAALVRSTHCANGADFPFHGYAAGMSQLDVYKRQVLGKAGFFYFS